LAMEYSGRGELDRAIEEFQKLLVIAVGIPITWYPPHRSGRALISASGSYFG
jgi:hypothetical protein